MGIDRGESVCDHAHDHDHDHDHAPLVYLGRALKSCLYRGRHRGDVRDRNPGLCHGGRGLGHDLGGEDLGLVLVICRLRGGCPCPW